MVYFFVVFSTATDFLNRRISCRLDARQCRSPGGEQRFHRRLEAYFAFLLRWWIRWMDTMFLLRRFGIYFLCIRGCTHVCVLGCVLVLCGLHSTSHFRQNHVIKLDWGMQQLDSPFALIGTRDYVQFLLPELSKLYVGIKP